MLFIRVASLLCTLFVTLGSTQIDPESVPPEIRENWCVTQRSSCPLLCTQLDATAVPESNECDPETLDWSCVCSNGEIPDASEFSQTIPFYVCTETNNQCEARCSADSSCASQCRINNPCGAQDPERVNATTSTTSLTSSPTASESSSTEDFSGFGGPTDENPSEESPSAANSLTLAMVLRGNGGSCEVITIAGGIFAGLLVLL